MSKQYLRLVRSALRSLRHPRLKRWAWWRAATRPIAKKELWIPYRRPVAMGITIGVFFSMLIVVPFQTVITALVCIRSGANLPLAMAFCWISNPLTFAPLLWMQCTMGNWMRQDMGVPMPGFLTRDVLIIPDVGTVNSASFLLGMVSFAVIGGLIAYGVVHLFAAMMPHYLPRRNRIKVLPKEDPASDRAA